MEVNVSNVNFKVEKLDKENKFNLGQVKVHDLLVEMKECMFVHDH